MKDGNPDRLDRSNSRISLFYWVFAVAYIILILTLAYRQLYLYEFYVEKGERQSMRRVIEPGARGDIFDRSGRLLVTNAPLFSAVVYFNEIRKEFREEYFRLKKLYLSSITDKSKIPSPVEISKKARSNVLNSYIDKINSILGSDYKLTDDDFDKHFRFKPLLPFTLVKKLSAKEHAILAEKIPINSPIQIHTDNVRYYPYGSRAAHALGYVSNSIDDIDTSNIVGADLQTYKFTGKIGKTGIERAFNSELEGDIGAKIWIVDLAGFQYDNVVNVKAKKGGNIVTSLDIDLQAAIEDSFGDRKGAAVVLDIKTGETLALVSKPDYDPNELSPYLTYKVQKEITERDAWLNRATQGRYPPGSTYKIITSIAALMTGVVDENSIKTCSGGYKVGSRIFPCNNRYGHGNLTLSNAIKHSCNVYFYMAGLDADIKSIAATAKDFGMDKPTGIEIGERRGVIPTPEYKEKIGYGTWLGGDTANTSIGQGFVLETPLEMAAFTASFARKQTRTKVSILHNPERKGGLEYHGGEPIQLTDKQYSLILNGMIEAVESGTCKRSKVEGINSAAKSGTAQVRINGKPSTLAWMIAFAPVENPQIAIAVMVEGEEARQVAGGSTAGPIVKTAIETFFEKTAE